MLLLGDLKSGFQEYHWRWQVEKYVFLIQPEKLWDGSNLTGKTILIYAEQGYGDTIQFIRYLPLVKQQGGRIILVCQKPLVRLLETIPGIEQFVEIKLNFITFDVHAPLLELPWIFGTTLDNIPPPIQNLNISHTKLIKLEHPMGNFLKVGIVWAAKASNPTAAKRSCKLIYFQSLLELAGVTFYSLQKEPGVDIQLLETLPILDLSSQLNDFADTAGIITQLDLVITVDTAVAHLAGTLGKPVWILLPFVPDWRWMLDRNDSPWYPTARLFRQPKIGDWHSVFKQIKDSLINLLKNTYPPEKDSRIRSIKLPDSAIKEVIAKYKNQLKKTANNYHKLLQTASEKYNEGCLEEAIVHYQKAISLQPNDSTNYSKLGFILRKEGRLEEAIAHYQKAISLEPNDSSNYSNLGFIFLQKDQIESAIANYEKSLLLDSSNPKTNFNLGVAWQNKKDLSKAETYYQQAINLQPDYAQAYHNLGFIFQEQGNFSASISSYQKAIELDPHFPTSHLNLSFVLLLLGDFKSGFQEYHWRWQHWETQKYKSLMFPEKLWDGSNLAGKIILLNAEQGCGDTIQFIRYLPLVKQQGGQIILAYQKPLIRLLEKIPEIERFVDRKVNFITFDVHAPLLELPRIFGTSLDNIPPPIPNLNIPDIHSIKLESPERNSLKIGIVWKTNSHSPTATKRSCKLIDFQPILDIAGITFYSLQKEPTVDIQLLETLPILDLSSQLNDFADTAGIITQLDLVITVDTAVAHLAGTLGKPVWILLPFVPDWRWMLDRNDSPWYPTARLFRQPKIGDWHSVFKQVKENLENLLDNNSPTNKISERKAIKLPEEAITKALAQYKSGKHQKNTTLSTFITYQKNLQTKTSTFEIMKKIAIGWPLNPMTGWGIYGINLTLQLLKNPEYQPLLLTPPSIQPGMLNPLHQALLNPAFDAQKNLQNQLKNHQGKKINLNLPILQALGSNFSVSNNIVGTKNIGIIFSENTQFTSEQINRSKAYDLIITGSTWNTKILESNGIKPVQKVLQGIDQTIFHPAPKSNIFGDRFVIFSGGKLEYRKGQDILIAAFKIFQKRYPEALLITAWHNFWPQFMVGIEQTGNVVGLPKISQNKRLQITQWLLENDIPSNAVIDVGPIPNYMVGQILRETDVAVFTNRCEGGTNLVAMESLACGIPTIISANTGHLDIINNSHCYPLHHQNYVKPTPKFPGVEGWGESDVEEVVEMLEKVYFDREDAQLRSKTAVSFMQDLTWEKQIQRLLFVLQNVI